MALLEVPVLFENDDGAELYGPDQGSSWQWLLVAVT